MLLCVMRVRSLMAVDVVSDLDRFLKPGWGCVMWESKAAEYSENMPYSCVSTGSVT